MAIETLKSLNPRNQNSISVIKSRFLSLSSMNTLLTILKVTDARRDIILAGGLYHRFPRRHLPPPPPPNPLAGPIFSVFFLTITDGERALVYRGSLYPPGMLVYFTLGFTLSAFPSFPRHLTQVSTQSVSQYSCMKLTPNLLTQRLVLNRMKLVFVHDY